MGIPVGINGFGRIGRVVLRIILERGDGFDLCGIFGGFDFTPAGESDTRWHIVARTRKTGDWYLCPDGHGTERKNGVS